MLYIINRNETGMDSNMPSLSLSYSSLHCLSVPILYNGYSSRNGGSLDQYIVH